MTPRRIYLAGSSGMLGQAFLAVLSAAPSYAVLCPTRADLDPRQASRLREQLVSCRPDIVINCAADTDVEAAEVDPDRAYAANALLPDLLAQASGMAGAHLIQFSSTGCYGERAEGPHRDFDELHPTTAHHRSKAAGEAAVREAGCAALILRLGWLFGGSPAQKKNFVAARINEARGKAEIASDATQVGCPTFADDVVVQTMALLEKGIRGTFNCVNIGAASRFDYVCRIVSQAALPTRVVPGTFPRRARVSSNETAINQKLGMLGMNVMPPWESALDRYVATLTAF